MRSVFIVQARDVLLALRHTDRVNDIKEFLALGVWRDCLQLRRRNGAAAASLHLRVKRFRVHVVKENQHFERTHVSPGRHQRHCHGNAKVHVVAKLLDAFVGVPNRIGDLLNKVIVRPIEDFFCYLHNQLGVCVRQGKNQRFRQIVEIRFTFRIKLRVDRIFIFLKHFSDLVANDNASVEVGL